MLTLKQVREYSESIKQYNLALVYYRFIRMLPDFMRLTQVLHLQFSSFNNTLFNTYFHLTGFSTLSRRSTRLAFSHDIQMGKYNFS